MMSIEDYAEEQRKINQINLVTKAIGLYEAARYGPRDGIAFDVALDEVLKQMGLED